MNFWVVVQVQPNGTHKVLTYPTAKGVAILQALEIRKERQCFLITVAKVSNASEYLAKGV